MSRTLRARVAEADPSKAAAFRRELSDYVRMLEAVKEQKFLRNLDATKKTP